MLTDEINAALAAHQGKVKALRINPALLSVIESERPELIMDWFPTENLTYRFTNSHINLKLSESVARWEIVKEDGEH